MHVNEHPIPGSKQNSTDRSSLFHGGISLIDEIDKIFSF